VAQFDDAWFEEWKQRMRDSGGNVILALGLRPLEETAERVVMEMPYGPNVRQGTGVFAAGAIIQLADVAATMACFKAMESMYEPGQAPFPVSIQISSNLIRNATSGTLRTETRLVHKGRTTMVAESKVTDEGGRLIALVTSTHFVAQRSGR